MDKHKLNWKNRLKLCFKVFFTGKYNPSDYKTIYEQEQWDLCRQRDEHMNKCKRPRTYPSIKIKDIKHSGCNYTDYFER